MKDAIKNISELNADGIYFNYLKIRCITMKMYHHLLVHEIYTAKTPLYRDGRCLTIVVSQFVNHHPQRMCTC